MRSALLVPLLCLLAGCHSAPTTFSRTTPVDPDRARVGLRAALAETGYSIDDVAHAAASGRRPDPESDHDHARKVAGAVAVNAAIIGFEMASAAATGHGPDFRSLAEPGRSDDCHAVFDVHARPAGGSKIEIRIRGVPAGDPARQRADQLWAAVARHVPLDPAAETPRTVTSD